MAVIQRAQVPAPVLRKETVLVPRLGGDVIVRGLLLSERLQIDNIKSAMLKPLEGETVEQAQYRAGSAIVFVTLERTVMAADEQPVFSAAAWDMFGSQHPDVVLDLYRTARRLSGFDQEATEKN